MGSPTNKNYNAYLPESRSRKTSRVFSSGSDESVYENASNYRKYSFATFETIKRLNLKRGSVARHPNSRRESVPFPVTEYATKWRKSAISDEDESARNKLLKHSNSDDLLQRGNQKRTQSWGVWNLVFSAKRKFSGGEHLAGRNRRLSVIDVLKLANYSRAEIQKRRMVRIWKQKARQKVIRHFVIKSFTKVNL